MRGENEMKNHGKSEIKAKIKNLNVQ